MRVDASNIRSYLRLYLVMGSCNCAGGPALVLEEAIRGGITMFQFREKGPQALLGESKLRLGRELRRICAQRGIPFIVNDEVELALALQADGVHIGQEDESAQRVRERMRGQIVGVSAHDLAEARAALAAGADYLGVGPMYPTLTKPDAHAVQGPGLVRSLRAGGIAAPIVGIGGIDAGNAAPVLQAGADGIAAVSAISQAASPREAAYRLRQVLHNFANNGSLPT